MSDKKELTMKEIMERLQEPFLPEEIEWRVGSTNKEKTKGTALAYVTNRAIQNRLDDIFGAFGWKNEYKEWKGKSQLCGISVYDNEKQEWIPKWDGADDSNFEATKGGLSDAMKRAAYQWGIGRYLYSLPTVWVPLKMRGNTPVLASIPELPDEALPKGYKKLAPPLKQDKPQAPTVEEKPKKQENPIVEERKSKMNKLITDKKMTAKAIKEQIDELQRKGLVSTTSTAKMTDDEFNIHMSLLYEYIGAA